MMNHKRAIKEMLSIPTGSRNVATSGYSSFTDSQFFFGSQFWPENSQGTSQDMSLSSMASQQSSEGSEPKFANSYYTKPLLFGDKSKTFGMLDKFEEDKKKAKDKADSDFFAKECHNFRETLNRVQQLVSENSTALCQTVLEKSDYLVSTLQNNLVSLQKDISQQFESLLNKLSSQKDMMTELEERVQKSGEATAELGSNLQSIKNSLECLREDQKREQNLVEEAVKLLNSLVNEHSAKPTSETVMDTAIQTSPQLEQPFSNLLPDNKLEDTRLQSAAQNLRNHQAEVPRRDPSRVQGRRRFTVRGHSRKKRPLVLSQRSKHTGADENCRPFTNSAKQQMAELNAVTIQGSLSPDCLKRANRERRSKAGGCFITPLSCWSQDSNSSVCLSGIEPILEKLSAGSRTGTPDKPEGLWQLFDMDSDSVLGF